jgi:hypothetical protein
VTLTTCPSLRYLNTIESESPIDLYKTLITVDVTELLTDVKCDRRVSITTAWRVQILRLEEWPSDMKGSCEYVK